MMNMPTGGEKDCSKVCSKEKTGNMDCKAECRGCFGEDGNCDLK